MKGTREPRSSISRVPNHKPLASGVPGSITLTSRRSTHMCVSCGRNRAPAAPTACSESCLRTASSRTCVTGSVASAGELCARRPRMSGFTAGGWCSAFSPVPAAGSRLRTRAACLSDMPHCSGAEGRLGEWRGPCRRSIRRAPRLRCSAAAHTSGTMDLAAVERKLLAPFELAASTVAHPLHHAWRQLQPAAR